MKIQYLFTLTLCISCLISCNNETLDKEKTIDKTAKIDTSKIVPLKKNNVATPESKDIKLAEFSESSMSSYIINDLGLNQNEAPELTYYNENVIGDNQTDMIVAARLLSKAENKYGAFNHLNDRNFGYMGKFHFVYVVNKENLNVERIDISASAVIPLIIDFIELSESNKTLSIDYSIREASFKFLYGQTPIGFQQLFTWQNFNLKKYENDKSAVNFIAYETNGNTKFKDILIYNAEITNYDHKLVSTNIYEFIPEISKKDGLKRTFFMDTVNWKYQTYLKM